MNSLKRYRNLTVGFALAVLLGALLLAYSFSPWGLVLQAFVSAGFAWSFVRWVQVFEDRALFQRGHQQYE